MTRAEPCGLPLDVIFAYPDAGLAAESAQALRYLTPGGIYGIRVMEVGQSSTYLSLYGVPQGMRFSSVFFEPFWHPEDREEEGEPVPDGQAAAALLRKRLVLHMLHLATQNEPGASWTRLATLAVQLGAKFATPIRPHEVRDLRWLRVMDLYDPRQHGLTTEELKQASAGITGEPQ